MGVSALNIIGISTEMYMYIYTYVCIYIIYIYIYIHTYTVCIYIYTGKDGRLRSRIKWDDIVGYHGNSMGRSPAMVQLG